MSLTPEPISPRHKLKRDLFRLVLVVVFFAGVAWLLQHPYIQAELFDIARIRQHVQGTGLRGVLWFTAIGSITSAIGLPRLWVSAVAGTLYGAVFGTFIGMVASLLGSTYDFFLGRTLLRSTIERRMPVRMRRWYELFNKYDFRAILYMRLFPLANATLTNLLGGVSRMTYSSFISATFLGFIPFTVVFATLGSSAAKRSGLQMALGMGLFLAVLVCQWLWTRRHRSIEEELPLTEERSQ